MGDEAREEARGEARVPPRSLSGKLLDVLGTFQADHTELTLSQISRRSGLPLSTTHRLVRDLATWGALERSATGTYHIGLHLWEIASLAPRSLGLREIALPYMEDLYEATHENVQLAVRDGLEVVFVERLAGRDAVRVLTRVGGRFALHATGVGRILLAYAPPEIVDGVLRSPERITKHTIVDARRLRREMQAVRERGFARTAEEMTVGTCSVAVPVFQGDGDVAAALGIVVTSVRRDLMRLVPVLQVAARGISRRLAADPVAP